MHDSHERHVKWNVLFISVLASLVGPFIGSAIIIALPTIGMHYKMDPLVLNWASTAYLLSSAAFLLPFGRLADIYGRKRIFFWGMIVFSITCAAIIFAPDSTSTSPKEP